MTFKDSEHLPTEERRSLIVQEIIKRTKDLRLDADVWVSGIDGDIHPSGISVSINFKFVDVLYYTIQSRVGEAVAWRAGFSEKKYYLWDLTEKEILQLEDHF